MLQRIVDARQVDFKSRDSLLSGIKSSESRVRSTREANQRADTRRMSQVALENQKIAVKLFTQKPTY